MGQADLDPIPDSSNRSDESGGSGKSAAAATEPAGDAPRVTTSNGADPEPPAAPPAKTTTELQRRLLTAAILIPIVLWVITLGGLVYLAVVLAFLLLGQREFYGLIEGKGARPVVGLGLAFGAALAVVSYVGNEYHATLLLSASLLGLMVAQLRRAEITEALASISGTFFGVFYVGWLLSHAIVLRNFYGVVVNRYGPEATVTMGISPDTGVFLMIFTLAVVVGCDAGAYFAGRAWGRHKLAPGISPGKSVEGAVGGVLAGALFALIFKGIFDWRWPEQSSFLPWDLIVPIGVVLAIVGILGDLVESMLKRDADVKDAGQLLPGMGGVLDRIDAPLLAIPVMYYMLLGYLYLTVRVGEVLF